MRHFIICGHFEGGDAAAANKVLKKVKKTVKAAPHKKGGNS